MADTFFPFSSGPGASVTDDQWGRMASLWAPSGVVPGSPAVTLGSGLAFVVPVGLAAFMEGFFYERTDTPAVVTALDNPSTLPRRDRLVLRLDRTAKTITPHILQGTPASGTPQLPLLAQETSPAGALWDLRMWHATCPGSASAQNYSQLTDERAWTGGDEEWIHYSPTITADGGVLNLGAGGSISGWFQRPGDLHVNVLFGSSGVDAKSGPVRITLPDGWTIASSEQSGSVKLYHKDGDIFQGLIYGAPGGTSITLYMPNSAGDNRLSPMQAASQPGAIGTGIPHIPSQYTLDAGGNIVIEAKLRLA